MEIKASGVNNWDVNEMKKLARDVFDTDGEKMLTFGLFGRRSVDSMSPIFDRDNHYQKTPVSRAKSFNIAQHHELYQESKAGFGDDSSGVTDVSMSVGSDSSYSNESYNSYERKNKSASKRPEISAPLPITQYNEVCSLKYDPKIRCRCATCKSKMGLNSPEHIQNTKRSLSFNARSPSFKSQSQNTQYGGDNIKLINGFDYQGHKVTKAILKEDGSEIKRNSRRYRSYTPRSQKEQRYKTLQLQGGTYTLPTENKVPYSDDFEVDYAKINRSAYAQGNISCLNNNYKQPGIQEQTAGYYEEGNQPFPTKFIELKPSRSLAFETRVKGGDDKTDQIDRLRREYGMFEKGDKALNNDNKPEFFKELKQIEVGYQEIEQRLKKEKFYRRSYIAAQEDIPKVKSEDVKLSVFYKKNGPLVENIKSPVSKTKSLTNTPVSSPGSITRTKSLSGRTTENGCRVTSPKSQPEVTPTKQSKKLLRTTSFRKSNKKHEKVSRSKSFSEADKKNTGTPESKSPDESVVSSPSIPREPPCIVNIAPIRRKQIYHLDEEDSPEEGLRTVLDQLSRYQKENKAVPLFLNVIHDLRSSYNKLLKESGKLKDTDSEKVPHDIIRKYSIPRKPKFSEAAKRSLEAEESKENLENVSVPLSPKSDKIRVNGDDLFYKVALRKKSTNENMENSCELHENGNTPIHQAANNGNLDILQILILNGGDVNALNAEGWPALHLSLQSYHFRSALFLIEAGADLRDYTNRRVHEYHKVQEMARKYFQYFETEL